MTSDLEFHRFITEYRAVGDRVAEGTRWVRLARHHPAYAALRASYEADRTRFNGWWPYAMLGAYSAHQLSLLPGWWPLQAVTAAVFYGVVAVYLSHELQVRRRRRQLRDLAPVGLGCRCGWMEGYEPDPGTDNDHDYAPGDDEG